MKKVLGISFKFLENRIARSYTSLLKTNNSKLKAGSPGFTLLLAALISSIVLSLGAAVFSIAQKQLVLSALGRNSQFAFYAADTAAECALYWDTRSDKHPNTFATSSVSVPASSITCDHQSATLTVTESDAEHAKTAFSYAPNGYCASVTLTKRPGPGAGSIITTIHADGYSTKVDDGSMCESAIQNDPQALQRSVELNY